MKSNSMLIMLFFYVDLLRFVSFLEDTGYYHVKLGNIDTTNFRGLQPSESDETLMDGYFGTGDKWYPAVGFLGHNNIWRGIPCFFTTQIQLCPVVELYVRLFPGNPLCSES